MGTSLLQQTPKAVREHIKKHRANTDDGDKTSPFWLKKRFLAATNGKSSKFLLHNYGCLKCPLREHCPDFKPNKNRICDKRAQMFLFYFKHGKGEVTPLLQDQINKLDVLNHIEYEKSIIQGKPTEGLYRLNQLLIRARELMLKATVGIKINHEVSWVDRFKQVDGNCEEEYTPEDNDDRPNVIIEGEFKDGKKKEEEEHDDRNNN